MCCLALYWLMSFNLPFNLQCCRCSRATLFSFRYSGLVGCAGQVESKRELASLSCFIRVTFHPTKRAT